MKIRVGLWEGAGLSHLEQGGKRVILQTWEGFNICFGANRQKGMYYNNNNKKKGRVGREKQGKHNQISTQNGGRLERACVDCIQTHHWTKQPCFSVPLPSVGQRNPRLVPDSPENVRCAGGAARAPQQCQQEKETIN